MSPSDDKTDKTSFVLSRQSPIPFENFRVPRFQTRTKHPNFAPRIDSHEIVTKSADPRQVVHRDCYRFAKHFIVEKNCEPDRALYNYPDID